MRFWTSDLHIGHENIIKFCDRPFTNTDHMREEIIRRWNEVVGPEDDVWLLGDIVMGNARVNLEHLRRLNGRKRLVTGNHDKIWRGNKPGYAERWWPEYAAAGLDIITDGESVDTELGGRTVRVSHFPYYDIARHEDKYADHRPKDDGHWLICGHVHQAWKVSGRQINVGVDVWDFTPVSDEVLIRTIKGEAVSV
jgi:calcineurin-like phosphoesterase family protein